VSEGTHTPDSASITLAKPATAGSPGAKKEGRDFGPARSRVEPDQLADAL
jgi:hypothetical protein